MDGMDVVAIMDIPAVKEPLEALCRENGVANAVTDFEDLCALDIDTIYVAVPNFLHYMYCEKALNRGYNVIVEKPMTSNIEEAEALKKIAEEKNLFLFEAVTTIYFEAYEKIRTWLPEIGTVKMVSCNYSQYSSRYDLFREGQTLPAFDPAKSGGALMDLNLYNIHYVMGMFGKPESISYFPNMERNIDTSGVLMMLYPNFTAVCTAAKDCNGDSGGIIQGTNGFIKTEMTPNKVGAAVMQLRDGTVEVCRELYAERRMIPEFTEFIRAVEEEDYDFCYSMLQKSLDVNEVLNRARIQAGIKFR
jgi:predicted dehydrogenase